MIFIIQLTMMKIELSRIVILSFIIYCTVALSIRDEQFIEYNHYKQPPPSKSADTSIVSVIIGIGFICICGFGCVYCYRRITNRNANTFSSANNQYNPNIRGHPQYLYPNPAPVNHQNQLIYNQGVAAQPQLNPNSSVNPYIVQSHSKINKACDLCNIKSKIGEQPRIMINCPSQHFFHLTCIGSAVHPPNVICPKCGQVCLSRITLFCSSCKQNNVMVNISDFMYRNELDIDALKAKYGDLCQKCLNQ